MSANTTDDSEGTADAPHDGFTVRSSQHAAAQWNVLFTACHCQELTQHHSRTSAPSPTTRSSYQSMRSVFRAAVAVADRVIATDPSIGVALPRRRKAEAAMWIPSVEEVGRLLATQTATVSRPARDSGRTSRSAPSPDFARARPPPSRRRHRLPAPTARRLATVAARRQRLRDFTILSEHVANHLDDAEPRQWLFTSTTNRCTTTRSPGAGVPPAPRPGFLTSGSTTSGTSRTQA